ncbi:Single-stranded-DNA-specific exonuclease RecJ [Candidatus Magnetaquicoccaceae bacterium FCR-1]|uniref:Single-stranded-DNA-specific exonuclease RecJ n=1 Tax=Candidatus Magnetaquiglobus chichijimensis TaxID=3141448 RepID=A0ABQ0C7C2_9PROT
MLSLTGKSWQTRAEVTEAERRLTREFGLHPLFAPIIAHRQLKTPDDMERYLRPLLSHLADPLGLAGMETAVTRLVRMLEDKEPCAIFGDYDVDGVTSSALLHRYLGALGQPPRIYIPDRMAEGYGPNGPALRRLHAEGVRVVITVDCGITAFEALEEAASVGLDVIVTDHHQAREALPPAVAVINPNRRDDEFPHKELAGVGVAFYLVMALNRALRARGWFNSGVREPDLKGVLDLVAIGTIADVASLTGLNRTLTTAGLRQVSQPGGLKIGLAALMEIARLHGSLSAGQVGFQIGPRLNAGGRLGRGMLGAELLISEDPERAREIAAQLEAFNQERQGLERRIQTESVAQVERLGLAERRMGLVVAGEGWHPGVVGIVASRLMERYHRPVVVVALDGEGGGKGSARSIPGVDLLAAVEACAEHLQFFGGHRAAAGVTLQPNRVEAFAEAFDQAVRAGNDPEVFLPTLRVDGELPFEAIDLELAGRIERLQPFGRGNPEPVWVARDVRVMDPKGLNDKHVKCHLVDGRDRALEAIAFGVLPGPLGEGLLRPAGRMDVAGTLSINRYHNRERVQFLIKDARVAVG